MDYPLHKNIVLLQYLHNGIFLRGLGILISQNIVLTCAHNLIHPNNILTF